MRKLLFLNFAQPFGDFALLLLRLFVGLALVWSAWNTLSDPARMGEYAAFLAQHHFAQPKLLAPLSAYAQLAIGIAFVLGLFTRWAGILCVVHFIVAIVMIDGGPREIFPAGCLVAIGLYLATHGAGGFSVDSALKANELPRSSGGVRLRK